MIKHKFYIDSIIFESIKKHSITALLNNILNTENTSLIDSINEYAPPHIKDSDVVETALSFTLSDNCTKNLSIIHANNSLTLQQTIEGLLAAIIIDSSFRDFKWQNRHHFK